MFKCIQYIRNLTLLLVLISPITQAFSAPKNESKPNIVLVLMDNFGYGEIGV